MPDAPAAGWLARGLVVVLGELDTHGGPEVTLSHTGDKVAVPAQTLSYPPADGDSDGERRTIVVASVPGQEGHRAETTLIVKSAAHSLELDLARLARSEAGLAELVLRWLAPLEASSRNTVLDFLATTAMSQPSLEAAETLSWLRQALRERLPVNRPSGDKARAHDRADHGGRRLLRLHGGLGARRRGGDRASDRRLAGGSTRRDGRPRLSLPRPDVAAFFASSGDRSPERNGFVCFVELAAPPSSRRAGSSRWRTPRETCSKPMGRPWRATS